MVSRTRYARAGDVHIAWAELGDGPVDLVFCSAYVSHVEHLLAHPLPAALFERLARFCRVILFDRRGAGLSDRVLSASFARTAAGGGSRVGVRGGSRSLTVMATSVLMSACYSVARRPRARGWRSTST